MAEACCSKFRAAIQSTFRETGFLASDQSADQLARLCALLVSWNRRINLTAIVEPADVAERHIADSALVSIDVGVGDQIVDCGTGAGFPGLVLAVLRPDVHVTMVERIGKKVSFVRAAIDELRLPNAKVLRRDLAALAPRSFDRAISRAVMAPTAWLSAGAGLVRHGGRVGVMTAGRAELPPGDPAHILEGAREVTLRSAGAVRTVGWYRCHHESMAP